MDFVRFPLVSSSIAITSYYKHGTEREVYTFEVTTLEVVYHPTEVPLPGISAPRVGPSSLAGYQRRGSPSATASPKKNSFRSMD